jgi:DNA-binding NarL/FixJ family response regulator
VATDHVLLVAQSPVLRYGIRGILETVLALGTVTEAGGAIEAAASIASASPSVIVIHDALPGVTGDVTARMLRELQPGATIVILSDDVGDAHVIAAARLGADALLPTAIDPAGFASAVSELTRGRRHADAVAQYREPFDRLIAETGLTSPTNPGSAASMLAHALELAAGEIAVLDGMVRGHSVREIADRLLIQEQVVRTHTASLLQTLGADDLAAAIVAAVRLRLVNLSDQLPSPPLARDLGIDSVA